MNLVIIIQGIITIACLTFIIFFARDLKAHRHDLKGRKGFWGMFAVGNITVFFDTLGIGNFAPRTACFKLFKMVDDVNIPGTLNAGSAISMSVESLIYINSVEVEAATLISLILSAGLGSFLGAGFVSKLSVNKIRIGMGIALIVVVFVMLMGQLNLMPVGGEALGLHGSKLAVAVVVCFCLGVLMTIGIGAYAPTMALVYLLGMDPLVAFPIMMGSCSLICCSAGIRFVKEGKYDRKAVLNLSTVGLLGIFVAVFLITSMPLYVLKWLVICVITYTSIVMLRDGLKKNAKVAPNKKEQPV